MSLDLARTHGWIVDELAAHRPIQESMERLIDRCAAARPHADWSRLRALPFSDLMSLSAWIELPFRLDPPVEPLRGLWFGLFNPSYDDGTVADLYVCGSNRFDPDAGDNSWAVGPDWWPEHRYSHSRVLADIYRIAYSKGGLGNDAEYPLCLAYGALAVRDLLNGMDTSMILESVGPVGVAVGFDGGDFVLLGRNTPDGLGRL